MNRYNGGRFLLSVLVSVGSDTTLSLVLDSEIWHWYRHYVTVLTLGLNIDIRYWY